MSSTTIRYRDVELKPTIRPSTYGCLKFLVKLMPMQNLIPGFIN